MALDLIECYVRFINKNKVNHFKQLVTFCDDMLSDELYFNQILTTLAIQTRNKEMAYS
jgi:hypothetical protein